MVTCRVGGLEATSLSKNAMTPLPESCSIVASPGGGKARRSATLRSGGTVCEGESDHVTPRDAARDFARDNADLRVANERGVLVGASPFEETHGARSAEPLCLSAWVALRLSADLG